MYTATGDCSARYNLYMYDSNGTALSVIFFHRRSFGKVLVKYDSISNTNSILSGKGHAVNILEHTK